jgi:hypothetical protein
MELELLGHLVSQFPSEVEDALEDLTSWVEKSLEAQFSSSSPGKMVAIS